MKSMGWATKYRRSGSQIGGVAVACFPGTEGAIYGGKMSAKVEPGLHRKGRRLAGGRLEKP